MRVDQDLQAMVSPFAIFQVAGWEFADDPPKVKWATKDGEPMIGHIRVDLPEFVTFFDELREEDPELKKPRLFYEAIADRMAEMYGLKPAFGEIDVFYAWCVDEFAKYKKKRDGSPTSRSGTKSTRRKSPKKRSSSSKRT